MIINIRGTSGSGKSHIIREVMERLGGKDTFDILHEVGRRQPLGYTSTTRARPLFIPGHYETQCGGCDTIHGHDAIFNLVRAQAEKCDVLFEGLLVSEEVARTIALWQEHKGIVQVYGIDLPVGECLMAINARRRVKNPDAPPVNPNNTTKRVQVIRRAMNRIEAAGVPTQWGSRAQVLAWTLDRLG